MPQYLETSAEPLGNYSQAVLTTWPLIRLSGQVGIDRDGRTPGDPRAQAELVVDNIETILVDCGRVLTDVLYLRVYVTSPEAAAAWKAVRDVRFQAPYPASALLHVVALSSPEWVIEVEAVAEHSMPHSLDFLGTL